MDLIYINGGLSSVFESQVIALLEEIQSFPEINRVILLSGYRNRSDREKIIKQVSCNKFEIKYFKTYPNLPLLNWLNTMSIKKSLINLVIDGSTVFHIRGEILAMLSLKPLTKIGINCKHILVDVRGASIEEIKQYSSNIIILRALKILNSEWALKSLSKYTNINTISRSLREYILQRIDITDQRIYTIPCLSGVSFYFDPIERLIIRNRLEIKEDEIIFVFSSGGTHLWQNNDSIVNVANMGYKVLNLSPQQFIHPNIINIYVNYKEVSNFLSAADIALITRDNSIVNKVASPVKFSEFVCSGLPVISNGNVDIISEYIQSTGYGLILKDLKDLSHENVIKLRSISRKLISQTGLSTFSVTIISKSYLSLYKRMLDINNYN